MRHIEENRQHPRHENRRVHLPDRQHSAGRAIGAAYALDGTEQWRTTTRYDGLHTTTIPPVGGTAMALVNNGLGQNVQTIQYHDRDHTGPTDPADVTTYTYAPNGQLATVTDATGKNTWTTTYDLHARKVSATDPDTGTTTYTYDDADQLTTSTDAQHRTLAYTYDNLGRETAEYQGTTSGTKLADWTYDTVRPGLPAGSTHYVDGRSYSTAVTGYDNAGRATGNRYTIPAFETGLGGTYSFSTEYDPLTGAVATTTSPQKGGVPRETIYHDYGTLGQPTGLRASSSTGGLLYLVSETDYNPQAQVLRTNFQDPTSPYQVAVTNTYEDGTNRLASTLAQRATSTGYDITNRQYTYQPAGNLTKLADTPQDGASDVQCFTYDYRQRLTDAWTPSSADCSAQASAAALGGAAPYWTSWGYDAEDNRIEQVQHSTGGDATTTTTYPDPGASQPHAPQTVTRVSGNTTSTSTYGYDDSGHTLTRGPAGAGQTFTYDAEGNIASVTEADGKTSTYVYDADGNRLITRDPTGVTLTVGDTEVHVAAGTTTAIGTRYYTYNGQLIAERNGVAGVSWLMSDAQGTVYATVDAANLAVHKRYQDPYGVPRGTADGPWADSHGFLGGYQNTTGLTHLGARDYDPATGSFITPDPLLDPMNPLHLNAYTYGFDNPIANTDPTGLEPQLSICSGVDDRLACENWGYTGHLDSFYRPYRQAGIYTCNWSRDCLSKNAEVLSKGRHAPTRERAEQIYREYHPEGMTLKEILQVGWEMTGIPGAARCVDNPNWGDCLSTLASVIPVGRGAKALKALVESKRAERALDFIRDIDDVIKEDAGPGCPIPHSFTGDTRVLMADGSTKPISQVKVGDKITNTDPDSGRLEQHVVTAVHVTTDDRDRVDLQLASGDDQVIHTTVLHQIWEARTHHWVEAGQLRTGDQVASVEGVAAVESATLHDGHGETYDLTVEGLHAYYVLAGKTAILVHNCGGIDAARGGLDDTTYNAIEEAHGTDVAEGVDYQVQRMHDGSSEAADHEIPGIGHDPAALGNYFADWRGRMTHRDTKTGANVAYDAERGVLIVQNGYMIHGYKFSEHNFLTSGRYVAR
ncbi:polymorphic toxin-type HINT domain-containing protein [Amycolatopsis sp. NPDC050768]|uniref:polymorphic toxin-type HINT domain-containing protein n=1 Tax=Amycolatopsis sp. NPDC050768 TaxID=3154839 RepID=UPI00340BFDD9